MKSKKVKGSSTPPRTSEEDFANAAHRNAFSFLKNRFFSGNTSHIHQQQQPHERIGSPSPSTTSTQSKPWSIENKNEPVSERPLSRSFDEHSISEFNISSSSSSTTNTPRPLNKNPRPLSMMGIESLLNQHNLSESPELAQLVKQSPDAFSTHRRNSTSASDVSTCSKKNMNKLSLDLQNTNININFTNNTNQPHTNNNAISTNNNNNKYNSSSPFSLSSNFNNSSAAEKRTSLMILKEGYLFKKTDFKPFHKQNKLDRGWKLYRVILRGHKLYLYKVTSESPLRSLFPSSPHYHPQIQLKHLHSNNSLSSRQSLTFSLSSSSIASTNTNSVVPNATMKLTQSDFDHEARQVFFPVHNTSSAQGAVFMEVNQVTMQPKRQVYLITFNNILYICAKPDSTSTVWKIDDFVPISRLKLEYLMDNLAGNLNSVNHLGESQTPASPISINSMQSDSYLNHSHSNGPLLFNILYVDRPSIHGVYSTQYRELGHIWISTFQNIPVQQNEIEPDSLPSSRSGSNEILDDHTKLPGRMCDATQRCSPGIIYRDNRSDTNNNSILGGTIEALIHELLQSEDPGFLNVFLLTYTLFTTGSRVLSELKSMVIDSVDTLLQSSLLDLFTLWCQQFSLDVMGDVSTGMIEILGLLSHEKAAQVKDLVLKTVNENVEKTCEQTNHNLVTTDISTMTLSYDDDDDEDKDDEESENIQAYIIDGKRRDSINLSNLLITGLTPDVFLKIDPVSFARQIYLFHFKKHKQFYKELLNPLSYLPRPQLSVQMLNSLLYTTSAPHFLTKIIRNQILIDSQDTENALFIRSKLLEHWIRVGLALIDLGDMTGWCAVAMGVCSVGVIRLRETWKAVNRGLVNCVLTDWVRILTDYGLFSQDMWNEEWAENHSKFSSVLDASQLTFQVPTASLSTSTSLASSLMSHSTPAIPNTENLCFFGTIRQFADRYRKHTKKHLGNNNIINFDECQSLYDTITSSLSIWKTQEKANHLELAQLDLTSVGPLQSFFEHSVTDMMSVPHDYKYLQECSLACEPRIFGQSFDRRKLSGSNPLSPQLNGSVDVLPPSPSCLTFPTILDDCSLFNPTSTLHPPEVPNPPVATAKKSTSHHSKMSSAHSIRSIRSLMDEDRSIKKSASSTTKPLTLASVDSASFSKGQKVTRRRTYSFPPGGSSGSKFGSGSKLDLLESENSRTWLGSLIASRHHRTYSARSLIEAHRKGHDTQYINDGEILLNVQHNELVFKASAVLVDDETPLKTSDSAHSIDFLKKGQDEQEDKEESTLLVSIKAGRLEQLVDSLIHSVSPFDETLKEQWQLFNIANDMKHQYRPEKIAMDDQEYITVFFMTYRTLCSSTRLLDTLRRRFLDAKIKNEVQNKRKNSLTLLESYFAPEPEQPIEKPKEIYDWKKVAQIQLRVMNLILYWVEEHPYDFIDEVQITRYMSNFLKNARASVASWRSPLEQEPNENMSEDIQRDKEEALEMTKLIEQRIAQVREQFIIRSVCPCYDLKAIEFDPENSRVVEDLYQQLTSGTQNYHTTLQLATNKSIPLTISSRPHDVDAKSLVDTFSPESLLEQVDQSVRQLFNAVTMQDWIQTFDVFEAQMQDVYAWLPARKPSRTSKMSASLSSVLDGPSSHVTNYHILPEEVIISDIFFAIQNARRSVVSPSAFSDDDLILAFPGSIQYLYCMHFIVRSWVIDEISAPTIDSKTRVLRIEKFLQIVLQSKMSSEKFSMTSEEQTPEGRIPGFVEYAVASALVSPEVRLFTKAWHDVAMQHNHANLDHLKHLLNQIQKMQSHVRTTNLKLSSSNSFQSLTSQLQQSQCLVPSIGWLFERLIELGSHVPDTFDNKDNMINMDKRRYVYYLLQLMMNIQSDLEEQQTETKNIGMSFLLSPNSRQTTWKELRELALRENKKAMTNPTSLVLRGTGSKSHRQPIFNKLVSEQMDKLKKDFKEKGRIDKDWLSLQHKLQKKQIEQARLVEKLDKKNHHQMQQKTLSNTNLNHSLQQQPYNVMPRINSFLRGLRPQSMVTGPMQHIFPFDNSQSIMKASTVINLIHSTTSVASTYTKRDFVFRIVTEEGAQYLFQGMNREDMNDWMHQINNSAREGAVKRQSVLVSETMDTRHLGTVMDRSSSSNRRMSIYGVSLDELMSDGHIPMIVEICIREIENRGLEEVGIYRVAGTGSVVSALKAAFNKDIFGVDLSSPEWADINVVADAFKQFLRELPQPLLTYTYYDEFITASASEDHDQRIYLLKKVLNKLPYSNYTLLKRIVEHFVNVTDFEATNHMYATNLAIVFGPTLLQPTPGPTSFATTMSNLGHHQNIVKYLILNYHYLFDVESDEVEPLSKEEETEEAPQN